MNSLEKHFTHEIAALHSEMIKSEKDLSERTIHRLRIELKKIKLLSVLTMRIAPGEKYNQNQFEPYYDLFHNCGKLREAQVNRKLLPGIKLPTKLKKQFKKSLRRKAMRFAKKTKHAILHINIEKQTKLFAALLKHIQTVPEKKIKKLLHATLRKEKRHLAREIQMKKNHADIHQIRKRIKSIAGTAQLLNKISPSARFKRIKKTAESTGRLLGKQHDQTVLIHSLKKYLNKNIYPKNGNQFRTDQLLRKLEMEFDKTSRSILSFAKPAFEILAAV